MTNEPQRFAIDGTHRARLPRRRGPGDGRPATLEWPAWLALIERRRKLVVRKPAVAPSDDYFIRATCQSFRLDGIHVTDQEVIDAITHGAGQRKLRSRSAQLIRNHVAILRSVEKNLQLGLPLKCSVVVRWYTSIGGGLSTTEMGADRMIRLDHIIQRINSPQLRLQPALQEILRTYADLLADALFPSFNGILARLLLRYHLGRCALPFAIFDASPSTTASNGHDVAMLNLLAAIDDSYQLMLA